MKKVWSALSLLGMSVLAGGNAFAQTVDTTYFSTDRQVMAMAREGNTVYLGGWFTTVGTASGGAVLLEAATGNTLPNVPRVRGSVLAIVADGQGGWFLGGNFSTIGGQPASGLAHVLPNGSVDAWKPQLASDSGPGVVNALALSGTTLYVAGNFTSAGGVARGRLASFDLATGALTSWNPGADAAVQCLAVDHGSAVYAGGAFTSVGGAARNRLAALDPVTGAATGWDAQIPPYDGSFPLAVRALALGSGSLYVGGTFNTIGGATRRCIAEVQTSNGSATSWNPDAGVPGPNGISAIAVAGGLVYAGGVFQTIGGQARSNLAGLDASGAASAWNPAADGQVTCLALQGGVVYAGGGFRNVGGAARSRLAALDSATGAATPWDPAPNSSVFAVAASGDTVVAGGVFTLMRPATRRRLAAFDATTHELLEWNPDADDQVDALVVHDGKVYIGGVFRNVGGVPRDRLAALDGASGVPLAWAPGASARVSALAFSGDTLFAGGSFQTVGGLSRSRLAAFDMATGNLLTRTFDANGEVRTLTSARGRVFAGGAFTTIGGLGKSGWAAIDPAQGVVSAWTAKRSVGTVSSLVAWGDTLYAGHDNGVAAVRLATGDTTDFRSTLPCGTIEAVAAAGGVVYAGGSCLVALHGETGASLPWELITTNIRTMLVDGDALFIGFGQSVAAGNSIQTGFVRVSTLDLTTPALGDLHAWRTPEGVRLEWWIGGAIPVRLERAPALPGPWRDLDAAPVVSEGRAGALDREATGDELWYRLTVRLADGSTARFGPVRVPAASAPLARSGIVSVSPNPATGVVRVQLAASVRERVHLGVFDVAGRRLAVLHEGDLEPGAHAFVWEARGAGAPWPAGVYFVRWQSASRTEERRVVIAR